MSGTQGALRRLAAAQWWWFCLTNSLRDDAKLVYEEELGRWPAVYRDGRRYILLAPLIRPVQLGRSKGIPIVIGFLVGCLGVGGALDKRSPTWWYGIVGGFIVAVILMPVFRWMYTRVVRIEFADGGFSWNAAGGVAGQIKPDEPYEAGLLAAHQDAMEERRREARSQKKPEAVFQKASQLVIRSGYENRKWQTVCEIGDDEQGERAYLLKTAIDFVAKQQRNELATQRATPAQERFQ